ncbi:ScyD/ScyE family protein [Pontibacter pamirensis]|uniref:ScyD/ScyE family protein n=1 Tax=Pontibacter pamirensis TaxID=2562824 RepID=UPI001389C3B3|nr:ScyD/ScyE family protein [Pontibacter pamirensis]
MRKITSHLLALSLIFVLSSCEHIKDYLDEVDPSKPEVSDFATGLATPVGLELDKYHRLWVAEAGTGMNDGRVSLVTLSGQVYPVIEGFVSVVDPEGNPAGLNHLLYDNGTLWILHGAEGRLYRAQLANFVPGDTPLQASELEYQEIGNFVLGEGFAESNLYKLTKGPEGDFYMADAGANAIIRSDAQTAELSVFAQFPSIENPTPVGPPYIDAVPTSIVFDEDRFLVTTLTGFPFLEGAAKVYEVDTDGQLSVYQDGLTTLVDIELGIDGLPLVLQFSEFGATGWIPATGKIIKVSDEDTNVLRSGLSFASDMELSGLRTAYVTNLAEGKVLRVKY